MKIIAKREVILAPLQAVIGVVERRQTMPILANVLLAAKDGQLAVTATDLEVELVPHADYIDVAEARHMVAGDANDSFSDAVLDFVGKLAAK